ncbi:MAG TPA: tryptophan--tRNA ligase [Acidobacteriaceae bacterium]|nr:tryptophan--tRNA ligase [Acidobacteriaceae bacterium]
MSIETKNSAPKRVLSGMRPTGRLHLGNYMGALKNWVALQNEMLPDGSGSGDTAKYECYFFIADFHALTTDYADTSGIRQNVRDVVLDFLAAGLDPKRSVIFRQSQVLPHFALHNLLEMITPLSWLERVPTYKDQQEQLREKDLATIGFLGYPVLQSADILIYRAEFVPVGQDQAAHVEITREIARRFNHLYGSRRGAADAKSDKERLAELEQETDVREILPEPKVLLTPSPKLPGTDGRKMSKSYGNTILMSDPEAEIRAKLKTMVTDPARVRRTDPGNPEVCPVFDLHKVFSTAEVQAQAAEGCRTAGIGCIQCKGWVADAVVAELKPIQERRKYFEEHPAEVDAVLREGAERARARTTETMRQVYAAVGLD